MTLTGQSSGAQATVSEIKLISDITGFVGGNFFIPDPSINNVPKFTAGVKELRLTSDAQNNADTQPSSTATDNFLAAGDKSKIAVNDILKLTNDSAAIEYMRVSSMTENKLYVERGLYGTTPVAHEATNDIL